MIKRGTCQKRHAPFFFFKDGVFKPMCGFALDSHVGDFPTAFRRVPAFFSSFGCFSAASGAFRRFAAIFGCYVFSGGFGCFSAVYGECARFVFIYH